MAGSVLPFDDLLKKRPSLSELTEHVDVGTKWYQVGVQLDLDTKKLDGIAEMSKSDDFKMTKMYDLWLRTSTQSSRSIILEVLRRKSIKETQVALEYEKVLRSKLIHDTCSAAATLTSLTAVADPITGLSSL